MGQTLSWPGSAREPEMRKNRDFSPISVVFGAPIVYTLETAGHALAFHTELLGGTVTFQVGDKVIYPNHGLGIVERIEDKTILGTTCGFFHLRIVANDTTVLVPVSNVDGVGLRRAISDDEVGRLFGLLGDGKIDNHQNWKGRFKDNSDKMRSGSIYEVADVLKSLTFLAKSKSLSFRAKARPWGASSTVSPEPGPCRGIAPRCTAAIIRATLIRRFSTRRCTRGCISSIS